MTRAPPRCYLSGTGLSALSSAQVTVSREGDGHGRGQGEKPNEEQKQIAGFAWSHDAPAMKADRRVIAPSPQPGEKGKKQRGAHSPLCFKKRSWTKKMPPASQRTEKKTPKKLGGSP